MGSLIVTFVLILFLGALAGFWYWVLRANKESVPKVEKERQEVLNSIDENMDELDFTDQVIDKRVELRNRQKEVEQKRKRSKIKL